MIMDQTTSTSNSPQELTNISRRCSRWPVIIWYCTSLIRTNVKTNLEIRLFSSFQGCSLINYWCSNGLCCLSVCVCLLNWLLQPVAQVLRCCRFHMVILKMAQKWNWISELSLYICSESLGLSADRVREHTHVVFMVELLTQLLQHLSVLCNIHPVSCQSLPQAQKVLINILTWWYLREDHKS